MKRRLGVALIALNLAVSIWAAANTSALFAQQFDPLDQGWVMGDAPVGNWQQVYSTTTENQPGLLGLATPDGRYLVLSDPETRPMMGFVSGVYSCDSVGPNTNLDVVGYANGEVWVIPSGAPDDPMITPHCRLEVKQLMDPTPCFTNASGDCDVAAEQ